MGDVDGDGVLDIVIATSLGHVWAVYDAPSTFTTFNNIYSFCVSCDLNLRLFSWRYLNVMPDDQPSNGQTGATLEHFPIRVDGAVAAARQCNIHRVGAHAESRAPRRALS